MYLFLFFIIAGIRSFKPSVVNNDIEKETVRLFKAAPEKYRKFIKKQKAEDLEGVEDREDQEENSDNEM